MPNIPTKVTVYTKNNCQPCKFTKRYLDTNNIPYQEFNVEEDPAAKHWVEEMGYQQVPVVVSGFKHWSGLRLDLLAEIPRVN